jgi:hypothetical protein
MKLYWTNKCKENNFRCPYCQLIIGNADGQLPAKGKNHRVQPLDGQVKCVVCNTTVGYFPRGKDANSMPVKFGWTAKILDTLDYVTAIEQKEVHHVQ